MHYLLIDGNKSVTNIIQLNFMFVIIFLKILIEEKDIFYIFRKFNSIRIYSLYHVYREEKDGHVKFLANVLVLIVMLLVWKIRH